MKTRKKKKRATKAPEPVASRARVLALLGLASAGVLLSAWLIWIHFGLLSRPGAGSACNFGGYFDCDAVNASRFATMLDVPIAYAGLLFYVLLGGSAAAELWRGARARSLAYARGFGGFAVLYSVFLAFVSFVWIEAFCLFCVALYLINLGLAVLGWARPAPRPGFWKTFDQDLRAFTSGFGLWPAQVAVLAAVGGALMLAGVERRLNERALEATANLQAGEVRAAPGHAEGSERAALTVVEFSDFQCKFCRKVRATFEGLRREFRGQVRFVFKHFPLDPACNRATPRGANAGSCEAAEAAVCAGEQERFWAFHDAVFDTDVESDSLRHAAETSGLDLRAWRHCRFSRATRLAVERDIEDGLRAGVKSTPTFIVGERLVTGARSQEEFAAIIREELAAPGRAAARLPAIDGREGILTIRERSTPLLPLTPEAIPG